MKFLITDDAGVMRKVIIRALLELNALAENIVEAEDGKQAVEAAKGQSFALIFMDWNMPNMLGIDALIEIRAAGITTPIMMVTTEGEKANVIRAIQAGANGYLAKPFTQEDFKEKVTQLIGEIPKPVCASQAKEIKVDVESGRIKLE